MMARRGVLGLLAGGVAMLLSACGSRHRVRYKMTVEVDTPQGTRTGSAVREVIADPGSNSFPFGENKGSRYLNGEAVAVDLPGGRTLFALLTSASNHVDYAKSLPSQVMGWGSEEGLQDGVLELWPRVPVKPHENPKYAVPAHLPMLVAFRDIADPKTVEKVEPANLAAHFGAGVRLKRISVEVTGEPVTTGIDERLKWLGPHPEPRLDSSYKGSTNPTLPEKLAHGDFRRRASK
jgi:hypothetical protein